MRVWKGSVQVSGRPAPRPFERQAVPFEGGLREERLRKTGIGIDVKVAVFETFAFR